MVHLDCPTMLEYAGVGTVAESERSCPKELGVSALTDPLWIIYETTRELCLASADLCLIYSFAGLGSLGRSSMHSLHLSNYAIRYAYLCMFMPPYNAHVLESAFASH